LKRIKNGDHWLDWLAVGEFLIVGRLQAMRRAGTNQPVGSAYNRAFGTWLDEHQEFRMLDKATRNHAMWAAENRDAIERWRETLAQNVRARINHPTTMKRAWDAANKVREVSAETPAVETKAQKLEREIVRLSEENHALKKRAEIDGSLFDLKKDTIEEIARAIAGNVSPSRLKSLHKAFGTEIARLAAEQKHAG